MEFPGILLTTWFIFVQLFLFTSFSSSRLVGNEVDRLSLLAFKAEITNDTLGTLSSWNASLHFCQWHGITCGRRHKRVTVLDLQSSRLVGSLSPHIGNLSFLRELTLPNNSFNDTIPPEIGRLFRLQQLRLQNNSFSGRIPFNISRCSNLLYLALSGNALSGQLSTEIGSLAKLQVLLLGRNIFSGKIPSSFGNLSSLQVLSAAQNNLQGGIPNRLGQLKSLTFISLGPNDLTGTIPPSIYNLSSITIISVVQNQLHGTLPPRLGRTIFPNLEDFRFHFNQFTGPIPTTISNASNLAIFGISENKFTGRIPSLARMSNLFRLEIDDNNLGNNEKGDLDFLSSLVNCTNLKRLDISNNNFGLILIHIHIHILTTCEREGWSTGKTERELGDERAGDGEIDQERPVPIPLTLEEHRPWIELSHLLIISNQIAGIGFLVILAAVLVPSEGISIIHKLTCISS